MTELIKILLFLHQLWCLDSVMKQLFPKAWIPSPTGVVMNNDVLIMLCDNCSWGDVHKCLSPQIGMTKVKTLPTKVQFGCCHCQIQGHCQLHTKV